MSGIINPTVETTIGGTGIGIKNGIIDGALTPKRHYQRMEEYNEYKGGLTK